MRVLLVDDNHELRLATRALLERSGYRVLEASRGLHALDLAESRDLDLLITDLSMPGMDGIELADKVTERLFDRGLELAVVLTSSDSDYPGLRQRLLEGGMAFLRKPFSATGLAAEIDNAFARKPTLRSLIAERSRSREEREAAPANTPRARPVPVPAAASTSGRGAEAGVSAGAEVASGAGGRPAAAPARRSGWRRSAWPLAAAAILALTVAGTLRTLDQNPPPLPPPPPETTVRSAVLETVEPRGPLAELPELLRWEAVAASHHYLVEVRGVDEKILWSGTSRQASLEVPAELAAVLHPAVTYTWRVTAFDETDIRLAWSASTRFRVVPDTRNGGGGPPSDGNGPPA